MTRRALTVAEYAEAIGRSEFTVRRWCRQGLIDRAQRIGGVWVIWEGYDDLREVAQRGEPVPPEPRRPVGRAGDDARWAPPVPVVTPQER